MKTGKANGREKARRAKRRRNTRMSESERAERAAEREFRAMSRMAGERL